MSERHRPHSSAQKVEARKAASLRRAMIMGGAGVVGIATLAYGLRRLGVSLSETPSLTPIEAFYPDMVDRKAKDVFDFKTDISRNTINVFNFSQAKVDRVAAKTILDYWEKTGYMAPQVNLNSNSDSIIEGKVTPEEVGTESFIFIVDSDAPNPFWNPTGQPALTVRAENSNKRVNLTLIRLHPLEGDEETLFPTDLDKANALFITEACQTSLVLRGDSSEGTIPQEIFCNSLTDAIIAHQIGRSYDEYFNLQSMIKYVFPGLGGKEASVDPVSEDIFNKLGALKLPRVIIGN